LFLLVRSPLRPLQADVWKKLEPTGFGETLQYSLTEYCTRAAGCCHPPYTARLREINAKTDLSVSFVEEKTQGSKAVADMFVIFFADVVLYSLFD
jgi:hypothetical protein